MTINQDEGMLEFRFKEAYVVAKQEKMKNYMLFL